MDGGVRVERTDENFELRVYNLLLCSVSADEGESTNTLTIETLLLRMQTHD